MITVSNHGDVRYLGSPVSKGNAANVANELSCYMGVTGLFTNELMKLKTAICEYNAKKSEDHWSVVVARANIFKESAFNFHCISEALIEAILGESESETPSRIESRKRACPMSFASAKPHKCDENCAWLVKGEDDSNCAVLEIAYSLRLIENDTENAAQSLYEICKNMENANATP